MLNEESDSCSTICSCSYIVMMNALNNLSLICI